MTKFKLLLFPAIMVVILLGCRNDDILEGKYKRPDWLAGKVYTQILEQPELGTFARAIELTGYDSIINVSGSYTVFAPSDEAFNLYFSQNPNYNSIENIPIDELTRLVKYHIVQNPWSKIQLRSLDIYGWIDTLDVNNNEPRGFKRETLLFDKDRNYGVQQIKVNSRTNKTIIVDTLKSNWHRKVITDSRKFAPFFYKEYFNIYDLVSSDYEFYFNRSFEGSNDIYYANAKIESEEIFAENGFVYIVDRVVKPLDNAYQILANSQNGQFSNFLDLVNLFPEFQYNEQSTFEQPGADQGLQVDSLFDLTYPDLTFDINSEKTSPPEGTFGLPQNVTIRYHHGLMAPTNAALENFVNEYIKIPNGWGTLNGAPENIKRIIVNTNMAINPIYPTDFKEGFYNGEFDIVKLDEGAIVEKQFGSNTTFIGLNDAVVPRAFKSVTGPIYLKQGYSKIMYAIEQSGLLPALKRENKNYMLFVEPDAKTTTDSSFYYNIVSETFSVFMISEGGSFQQYSLSIDDLRTLLLNHVAINQPKGIARKEFIKNMAGNFIIVNNETGEFSGTAATTEGYRGTTLAPEFPTLLSDEGDNGVVYNIQNWFGFSAPSIFSKISTEFPKFHALLRKAGLTLDKEFRYNFISNSDYYSIFIPSDAALDSSNVNSLTGTELKNFLMLHFVQGDIIFTDGNKPAGYYETVRRDEKSTPFSTVYTKIYIAPDYDVIRFPGKDGSNYLEVFESETTNFLTGIVEGDGQEVFPLITNNGVIHKIDKVLSIDKLDTN